MNEKYLHLNTPIITIHTEYQSAGLLVSHQSISAVTEPLTVGLHAKSSNINHTRMVAQKCPP